MGKMKQKFLKTCPYIHWLKMELGILKRNQKYFRLLTINSHCTTSTKIVFEKADNIKKHHSPLIWIHKNLTKHPHFVKISPKSLMCRHMAQRFAHQHMQDGCFLWRICVRASMWLFLSLVLRTRQNEQTVQWMMTGVPSSGVLMIYAFTQLVRTKCVEYSSPYCTVFMY